jgi:hypothetical protein
MFLRIFPPVFLLILLIKVPSVSAQQKYEITAMYESSSVFRENFDDNNNDWITDNSWIIGRIENGHYIVKCKNFNNSSGLSYKVIPLDKNRDFEIEATLQITRGTGGLLFGMTGKFDHYRIEITDKNDLILIKNTPSKNRISKLLSISKCKLIKTGSPVKITVRKLNNIFYLFINESFVREFINVIPEGDQIGFNVGINSEISADYLSVSYLKKLPAPVIADKIPEKKDSVIVPPKGKNISTLTKAEVKPLTVKDAPVIKWISPVSDTTYIDSYSARVRAGIRSASDLKSVLVYVNGTSKGEGEWKLSVAGDGEYVVEKSITFNPGNNSVYFVASNFAGAAKSAVHYFKNPDATLPVISWTNPLNTVSVVNTDRITVEVCINSPSGLYSAKILVNGEERGGDNVFQSSGSADCNVKWQKPVILKEGDNSIYIIANNIAGSMTSESRIIRFVPALEEKRIALVLGNADYINGVRLKNPVNDANLMEATLKELGFDVIKRLNSGKDSMMSSIREFSRKLSAYNVALFYYAGHGMQVDGVNYLIPINAELQNREDCKWEAVDVTTVTDELKNRMANTNIVILDACRNNPYRSWARGGETGFKALGPINGTIISFATSEGATAADGTGANGLFTEELVKQMVIPQPIESVFKRTRKEVIERSNGQQTPTEWSYLTGEFYFKK